MVTEGKLLPLLKSGRSESQLLPPVWRVRTSVPMDRKTSHRSLWLEPDVVGQGTRQGCSSCLWEGRSKWWSWSNENITKNQTRGSEPRGTNLRTKSQQPIYSTAHNIILFISPKIYPLSAPVLIAYVSHFIILSHGWIYSAAVQASYLAL